MRGLTQSCGRLAGLAALLLGACGDGVAEPIVADLVTPALDEPGGASSELVAGLCGDCPGTRCGDESDLCVEQRESGETFCARDCEELGGCPPGYRCGRVAGAFPQCVPEGGTCQFRAADALEVPPLGELRAYMLEDLNELRAEASLEPLAADACLDGLAQTSAVEMAREEETSIRFQSDCGWAFETRGAVARFDLNWQDAATALWRYRADSDARRIERELLSTSFGRIGIGIVLAGDEAWIVLSYGE